MPRFKTGKELKKARAKARKKVGKRVKKEPRVNALLTVEPFNK